MVAITQGSVVAGKYRLHRPLGQGGMGAVWVARHVRRETNVAVKLLHTNPSTAGDVRPRFEREARASAMLQSPHVAQIHEYGVDEGVPYVVMELLDGEDLGARLEREGRLSLPAAAAILTQTCRALHRAHEAGVVHRGLEPSDLFLTRHDDGEMVKVLDFGIAWAMKSELSGAAAGAEMPADLPHYMSPEQVEGARSVDFRSDLWSLAVILFRALTGRLPFPGDEAAQVVNRIRVDPIPVPSHLAPELGPEVDRFFARALSRDPRRRFQSARALGEAFGAIAGTREQAARRDTPPDRPRLPASPEPSAASPPSPLQVGATMAAAGAVILGIVFAVATLERFPTPTPSAPAPTGEPEHP
jgi:serine/threonine-protein kinase